MTRGDGRTNAGHAGRLPNAVMAAVPKAGTSALARSLGAHPDVFLPPDKEVHYFDEHPDQSLEWYQRHFAGAGGAEVVLDATPTYALRDDWFRRLTRTLPGAKVIVLLRHPVERLWSAYWYLRSMGLEPRTIEDAIDAELEGSAHLPYAHVATGVYTDVLDRVDRHCQESQVLVLLHDDLVAEPERVFGQVCDFLAVERVPVATVSDPVNVTGMLRSYHLRYWTLRLRLFRRAPALAHAIDRWNRTDRRPPPMPADLRRRLLDHYAGPTAELERRLGRDLSAWKR